MLDEKTVGRQQEKLHVLLKELALSDKQLWVDGKNEELTTYFRRFDEIYVVGFRHQYSKLFEVVNSVFDDEDKEVSIFQENLKKFREFIMKLHDERSEELLKNFDKLRDHLSLEISRRENLIRQNSEMMTLKEGYTEMENKAADIEAKINRFSERLSKIQIDFVAILSIFAAVVVAFSSGSNYMLSSLSAVRQSFAKEVIFTVLICGLLLMDTLFMLIYFIGSIIGRSIGFKWWPAFFANAAVIAALIWICCN